LGSKVVVITGSTQGLGFGYAREFLRRGHNVVVSGRTQAAVDSAVARLAPDAAVGGGRAVGVACDVADLGQVQALWDAAVAAFGRVDVWLQNAGYARTGVGFLEHSAGEIEAMVRSNVIGSMHAAQVAVAGMQRQGGGRLYLTLGGGGATGRIVPGMSVYSSTKRAVKYLADTLVKELREAGDASILVGTISPGINVTEGLLREMRAVPAGQRARALRQLEFIGDHVETTTPWIVERVLEDTRQGNAITWLTASRMLGRGVGALLGRRRDLLARYPIEA
jgi:NAD(P)-dependent dehydrogenase (short-subunit alcohol dehydrogenase family)